MALTKGTRALVHYTGTLDDGTQFDSSRDSEPFEVIIGQGMVIPGFEQAIMNMEVGQILQVIIPEEEAYGPHNDEMVLQIPRASFPLDLPAKVGEQLILQAPDGQETSAFIVDVTDEEVVLDANHPLAGFALTFEIELLSVSQE
ncbi:MAG: peptidylprolyl isomerase [Desulfomicrobium sp.]|nr:peptidylprolyl isomerase [Desulfomicrobium sp.]